jgi:hypothetical protein
MPITVNPVGPVPNLANFNQGIRTDAQDAIAQLQYASLFVVGTAANVRSVRVDVQGMAGNSTQMNIQAQINRPQNPSTIAWVLVNLTVQTNDKANQTGVTRKVMGALNDSLDTGQGYLIAGSIP